ncbi:hypothetical protein [uncultured Oxalicibacterium sp.]|uniref:hypothetical protein n=1 Tax=uncultured Oxalicibacterium sp. TaxID=1168540 RepID=UPI0025CDD049|nr:hypothetical protein [uncultured Oxalicibacterium sp.]
MQKLVRSDLTPIEVQVYRFQMYDPSTDQMVISKRWGTRVAIERIGGQLIQKDAAQIPYDHLSKEIDGLTDIGYVPVKSETGWQAFP